MKPIPIAKPCPENWHAMPPEGRGRYCGTCERVVVDVAQHSERELLELLRTRTGRICIAQTIVADRVVTRPRWRGLVGVMAAAIASGCERRVVGEPVSGAHLQMVEQLEFRRGQVALEALMLRELDGAAASLKREPGQQIEVVADDPDGLGPERARAIVKALSDRGVSATAVPPESPHLYYGSESNPAVVIRYLHP